MAAAKEFNVGKDTLVDFLAGKGFSKDDLKPTSKLTEDMYRSLQQEFQSDKVAKIKSDQIDLPRGSSPEPKKKKDEEEIIFKKDPKKVSKEEEKPAAPTPAVAPAPVPAPAPEVKAAPAPAPVPAPAPEVKEAPAPAPEVKPAPPAPPVVVEQPVETVAAEPKEKEVLHLDIPEIEGPKILDKIDLSKIDSSTRPRKSFKPEETAPEPTPEPAAPVEIKQPIAEQPPVVQQPEPVREAVPEVVAEPAVTEMVDTQVEPAPVFEKEAVDVEEMASAPVTAETDRESAGQPQIENIKAEKLEGPKILGKIQLPVSNDTRPKSNDEKRKRKRIPIEKNEGFNRQPGQAAGPAHNVQRQGGPGQPSRPGTPYQGQGGPRPMQGGGGHGPNQGGPRPGIQRPPFGGGQNRPGPGGQRPPIRREAKEIDAKEIQDKIRETQAKLSGGGNRGKNVKAKNRRAKREEMAEHMGDDNMDNRIQVTEFISVSELANLLDVSYAEVIGKCMSLGMMVSINQRLDAEVIELVASEFGYDVEFMGLEDVDEMIEDDDDDDLAEKQHRAPIVTIMGHVDHGKTSLLDYIRSSKVVAGEAGGITQHIGAYEVELPNGKHICFLDTPGHEAFTAMRARGAKVTDIAVIVVAADDAVMPQTKEAISHAQAAGVPMIFAINKVDKDGSNPEKIREQLAGMNLLVEEWGGKYQSQELSAKTGMNVDALLEKILLEAELLDLKANPDKESSGTIIEATLDKGRGYVTTVLVQNGTLKLGDLVVSGQHFGRVKAMFNERNKRVDEAPPSTPVLILGLNGAPQAGEKFKVFDDESEAKEVASRRGQILREQGIRTKKHITLDEIGRRLALGNFKELNLIIKGDFDGSVEALSDSLQKLSTEEIAIRVVHKAVGAITESDVLLATASDAIIVGFQVRPSLQASKLAEKENIEIKTYSIIYNAIEEIKSAMEGMMEPKMQEKVVANVLVREVYKFDKGTVAGCQVMEGKIMRSSKVRLIRDGIVIYPTGEGATAELGSLKRYKDDVKEIVSGMECGLTLKNYNDLRVDDMIEAYEEEEVKRTL